MEDVIKYYNSVDIMLKIVNKIEPEEIKKQEKIFSFINDINVLNIFVYKFGAQHTIKLAVKTKNSDILHKWCKEYTHNKMILETLTNLNVDDIKFSLIKDELLENNICKYFID
jgi:hypothetical protein